MLRHSLRLTSKPFSKVVSLKNVVNKNIISMTSRYISSFKTEYDGHVQERAGEGIVPKPLDAEMTSKLVENLKKPDADESAFLVDLLENRSTRLLLVFYRMDLAAFLFATDTTNGFCRG